MCGVPDSFEGEQMVVPQLGCIVASDDQGGIVAGGGTVEMRVGDERVVGAEHRRVQRRGMCADLQSGDARNWLQACEGHPAAPRKVGADLLLLAALRDRV